MPTTKPVPRVRRLPAAWFLCSSLGLTACGSEAAAVRPRNAILISIDTLRPDHLGCYGHERDTSPALDRLAESGVRFEDVTSAAPWTLPAHATLFTGLYPSRHGVKSHETCLPSERTTLAEVFRDAGYQTFAVVNTHNVGAPQFQLDQVFGEDFSYVVETEVNPRTQKTRRVVNCGDQVLARAREMLRGRDADRPFFLFLHFYDVHTDFTPRQEYRARFVGPYSGRLSGRTQQLAGFRNRDQKLEADDIRWLREMYDAEIRQLDDLLAGFFSWLEAERLADETLLVVTSDHGEEFQEHGGILHGRTHYQELLRIPLLVSGPGVPAGAVVATPVHGVDVAPTLLALMGLRFPEDVDGLDLAPLWSGSAPLAPRLLFGEADHNNRVDGKDVVDIKRMVRRGTEKLHLDRITGREELYDLGEDPGERADLAAQEPERVAELRRELERFMEAEVAPETIPPPSDEELEQLEALGYAGGEEQE